MSSRVAGPRQLIRVLLAILATYALLLSATSGVAWAAVPPTQVIPSSASLADPTVVDLNGQFWAYGTDGASRGARIPMYRADNLTGPYTYLGKAVSTFRGPGPTPRSSRRMFGIPAAAGCCSTSPRHPRRIRLVTTGNVSGSRSRQADLPVNPLSMIMNDRCCHGDTDRS